MHAAEADVRTVIKAFAEWMAVQERPGDDALRWKALIRECISELAAVTL